MKLSYLWQVRGRPWPGFITERLGYVDALAATRSRRLLSHEYGRESDATALARYADPDPGMAPDLDEASE